MRTSRILLLLGLLLPAAVCAQENAALYQATAIVTGTDMRQRPRGFAECLTEVLIKVSGMPQLRDDPAVARLTAHADTFVAGFSYLDPRAWFLHHDDQGTYDRSYELTVHFDPAKIASALAGLGATPWRGPRPLLVPIIIVRRDSEPFLLSVETPRGKEMRQAIVRIAAEYGIGVHFPTEDDLDAWGISLIGFPAPLGASDPGQLRITGSLSMDIKALGWVGIWHVSRDGHDQDWQISGVGFDQAFTDMIRGAVVLARGTVSPSPNSPRVAPSSDRKSPPNIVSGK